MIELGEHKGDGIRYAMHLSAPKGGSAQMLRDPSGGWVSWEDYARLKAEVIRLQQVRGYEHYLSAEIASMHQENVRLKAEVERLTEALNKFTNTPNGVHGVEVKVSFWSKSGCRLPSSFSTFWMNAEKGQP